MRREPHYEERSCDQPGCPKTYRARVDSSRLYCDEHSGPTGAAKARRAPASEAPSVESLVESLLGKLHLGPPAEHVCPVVPAPATDPSFGPQEQVALFSDYHRGQVVDAKETGGLGHYDVPTAVLRLDRWRKAVVRFRDTYRFPVTRLWVLALGDDLEGHGKMFPSQAYLLGENLLEQCIGFVNDMDETLRYFAANYPQVSVVKVRGNHGRMSDHRGERPERDNLELILWRWLKDRLANVHNLSIEVADGFFAVADVLGHTFYMSHGEDIRPMSPYAASGGQNVKLRMNAVLGFVINYMVAAHHHYNIEFEREIGGRFMGNGCFIGPNMLSVKGFHEAVLPSQLLFAVHPKWGVTHRTNIYLATPEEVRDIPVYGGEA